MMLFGPVVVAAVLALPLPPYTDDEATCFVGRAEKLMADIEAGKAKRPRDFSAALAAVGIAPQRLRGGYTHVGNATFADEFRIGESYVLRYAYLSPGGQFQGIVVARRK
jgi:hypothetical protein